MLSPKCFFSSFDHFGRIIKLSLKITPCKVSRHKINIQKSIVFLNFNIIFEKEPKNTVPLKNQPLQKLRNKPKTHDMKDIDNRKSNH